MSNTRRLILPGGASTKVRNMETGRVLPCCWDTCDRDGSTLYEHRRDHDDPRWPGEQLIYVFCSPTHRDLMFPAEGAHR